MKRLYACMRGVFSTAHFYHQKQWDLKTNEAEFGLCFSEYGHGHNYCLDVTFSIPRSIAVKKLECDEILRKVKSIIDLVLRDFDHRHLNFTHPAFKTNERISTTEVLSEVLEASLLKLWEQSKFSDVKYHGVQVWETDSLAASTETPIVALARQKDSWTFTKLHRSIRLVSGECKSIEILLPANLPSKAESFLNTADRQYLSLEALCCALQENVDQPILIKTKSDYFLFAGADGAASGAEA